MESVKNKHRRDICLYMFTLEMTQHLEITQVKRIKTARTACTKNQIIGYCQGSHIQLGHWVRSDDEEIRSAHHPY